MAVSACQLDEPCTCSDFLLSGQHNIKQVQCDTFSSMCQDTDACLCKADLERVSQEEQHALMRTGLYFATSCNGFDGEGCEVCFWDRRQLKLIWQCSGHQQATKACIFLPSASTHLVNGKTCNQQEDAAPVGDAETSMNSGCLGDNASWMKAKSSVLLASASADGTVKAWELGQDQPVCTVAPPREVQGAMMTCLAVCSSEQHEQGCSAAADSLFAGTFSGHLHSWDVHKLCARRPDMD